MLTPTEVSNPVSLDMLDTEDSALAASANTIQARFRGNQARLAAAEKRQVLPPGQISPRAGDGMSSPRAGPGGKEREPNFDTYSKQQKMNNVG